MSISAYEKPRPGHVCELSIEGMTVKGQGVGSYGPYTVYVRGAVPGDEVVVRFRKVRHRRKEGQATLVSRSDGAIDRVAAACRHFGVCGGCLWQDLDYADQLKTKENLILDTMKPASSVEIGTAMSAPNPFGYRNKMEFSFGIGEDDSVEVGLHPAGRFGVIFNLEQCELVPSVVSEIVDAVRSFANSRNLKAYNLKTHEGLLRFLTVREGTQTGQIMVIVTTSSEPFTEIDALGADLVARFPEVVSVIHTINAEKAQVAFGSENHVVAGKATIEDQLGPFSFEISSSSFFQPNTLQAERMFRQVVSLSELSTGDRVLDAYCGTGGISFFLSEAAGRVLGVEVSEESIRNAVKNSANNGIQNCEFMSGPAEDLLGQLCDQGESFDVAVTDPPRAGMHHRALRSLVDLRASTIVYVSCNPAALANDVASLEAHGYELDYLQLVDMLPQTPHCEVLARLRK